MNEELHARCNARASGMERGEETRPVHSIQTIRSGVDGIPAQAGHHPRQRHVIGFDKTAAKVYWLAGSKSIPGCVQHKVLVVSVHIGAEQVEGAVVEAGTGSDPIEGLAGGQNTGSRIKPLHGSSIETVRPHVDIGVVMRTGCPSCLDSLAALRIPLQVDPVRYPAVEVFEVGVGEEAVAAGPDIRWTRSGSAGVLVHHSHRV